MDPVDMQKELLQAFMERNVTKFKSYLLKLFNARIDSSDLNIFEAVLSTAGSKNFVTAWFSTGFKNYFNPKLNKADINYAVESLDGDIILEVLFTGCLTIDHQCEGDTPLITLCKKLCLENVKKSGECILILTKFHANANISDNEGKTALYYIQQNEKIPASVRSQISCLILVLPELNEEEYRLGLKFVMQYPPGEADFYVYSALIRNLRCLSTDDILYTLTFMNENIANWNNEEMQMYMLRECSTQKLENFECALIILIVENNKNCNLSPIMDIARYDNWKILLGCLKKYDICEDTKLQLQIYLIRKGPHSLQTSRDRPNNTEDYESCLHLLKLEGPRQQELLMQSSILFKNNTAIRILLTHGAKLKVKYYNITDIEPNILEEHFNNCITSGEVPRKNIQLNFNSLNCDENGMDNVYPIAQEARYRYLLQHPLIECSLQLYWMLLRKLYYLHFSILIICNINLIALSFLRFPERSCFSWRNVITYTICAGQILFLLVEILLSYKMAKKLPIIRNTFLIFLLILHVLGIGSPEIQRVIAIFAIMQMTLKLIALIGALPFTSLSTNMLMLVEVTNTFMKCIAQYSVFLIIYALCFYVLFATPKNISSNGEFNRTSYFNETNIQTNVNQTKPDGEKQPFLTLSNWFTTFPKTLIMFFGQYDLETDFNSHINTWALILFMFMAMILTNLLSALAISDTQTIQSQAEINGAICRVNLLRKYEAIINVKRGNFLTDFFSFDLPSFAKITFYLKKDRKVIIHSSCSRTNEIWRKKMKSNAKKFDEKIISKALEIVQKTHQNKVNQNSGDNRNLLENISKSLQHYDNRFEQLQYKLALIQDQFDKRLEELSTKLDKRLEIE